MRHRSALLSSAIALAAIAPSAASAAPYEQVSRASGPAGASIGGSPLAVGDVGKFAGFRASSNIFVRDIRTNATANLGTTSEVSLMGFDRAETVALLVRYGATQSTLVALPLPVGSAPERVLYTAPAGALRPDARLSADGSTVAFNDTVARELRTVDVATGAVTTLSASTDYPQDGWSLREGSISTSGRTILGYDGMTGQTTIFTRTAAGITAERTWLGGMVSGDGSTVVKIDQSGTGFWIVRDPVGPAPWTTTRYTPPAPLPAAPELVLRWVSSNGSIAAVTRTTPEAPDAYPAFAVNTSTGVTAPFGGRFRESMAGVPDRYGYGAGAGVLLSPSGRMSLLPVSGQIVFADLTGTHVIGANEPLSADVYFNFWFTKSCSTSLLGGTKFFGTQLLKVRRPASWAPTPTRYDAQLLADTTLLRSGSPAEGQTWSVNWSGRPRYHRAKVTVTYPDGQTAAAERSLPGGYYGACYQ